MNHVTFIFNCVTLVLLKGGHLCVLVLNQNDKMKKIKIFTGHPHCFILVVFTAQGQTASIIHHKYVEFGIRFMPTFSSFQIKSSNGSNVKGEATLGFGVGALLGFNFNEHVGLQAEIIYNSISQKSESMEAQYKINLKYVNVPLLLSLNTGKSKAII